MENLHVVISRSATATYIKVSRECDRICLAGLLAETLNIVTSQSSSVVHPEDCELPVVLVVGDVE